MIKRLFIALYLILIAPFFLCISLNAQINGTVYRDVPANAVALNSYGLMDANELGVEGVTVTVFPSGSSTISSANGTWSLPATGSVRVEFSDWPAFLEESVDGGNMNSSVRFSAMGAIVNFGLHNPADFSQLEPPVATVHHVNGLSSASGTNDVLVSFAYSATGTNPSTTIEANKGQVGGIWGLAYSKTTKTLYSSAFLKRHVGLANGGMGAIYSTDVSSGANASLFLTIPNVGSIDNSMRGLGAFNGLSNDPEVFSKIGKLGLGDIDISDDEQFLYVVNLNDKRLYVIEISTQTIVSSVLIPDPICTNGDFRPFAVSYNDGLVYVGGICDAMGGTASDLRAYVYSLDPINLTFNTNPVLDFSLDYVKGGAVWGYVSHNGATGVSPQEYTDTWYPWVDAYTPFAFNSVIFSNENRHVPSHPQPILSDIEFKSDGSMILGFLDRTGHQFGDLNVIPSGASFESAISGGDILLANKVGSSWVIEPHVTSGNTEFFIGDKFPQNNFAHLETSSGGITLLSGRDQLFLTALDPLRYNTGGVIRLSVSNGGNPAQGTEIFSGGNGSGNFGKATGMGDIELLSDAAPIEIGNLIWDDTNGDGIQNSGEMGIPGVQIELLKNGLVIATALADVNGNYIFSNDPNATSTSSHRYNIAGLMPGMDYLLRVPTMNGANGLSVPNTGEGANTTINDSNADVGTGIANILSADIPITGANNHSFDIGYSAAALCSITEVNSESCQDNGTPTNTTDDYYELTVTGTITDGSGNYIVLIGGIQYGGTTASGSPITLVGDGAVGNPTLNADGASTYAVRLEDAADSNCFVEFNSGPVTHCSNTVCSVTQVNSELCQDNGTPTNTTDDYYELTVTGTVIDGSGNYIVLIGGTQYGGATASGSPITLVGDGAVGNPTLNADGASTYAVRIEDAADSNCFVEFNSGPVDTCSSCPASNCTTVTITIEDN